MKPQDFEIFSDHSYFDMWCLKPKKSKSFEDTLHFMKKTEALHALQTVCIWSGYTPTQQDFNEFKGTQ